MNKTATKILTMSATVAVAVVQSACSTASTDIAASYVSPMQYTNYDCYQLVAEAERLRHRLQQLGGRLDEAAANDKVLTGVGLLVFWPALFALGGTKEQEAEYARLKGEYDAVQQVAVQKRCTDLPPAATPPAGGAEANETKKSD